MTDMNDKETVLVTGGAGYLAGWTISQLLRHGFNVRATLRSLQKQEDVRNTIGPYTSTLDNLSFVAADLLRDEGWMEATRNCQYVLHVASPMGQGIDKGSDLVAAAREGTLRVLRASAASGVQRVVFTSSGYAAKKTTQAGEKHVVEDEGTWTDLNDKSLTEYGKSKALAERAVWGFVEGNGSAMTVATIIPGLMLGPVMGQTASPSLEIISRLLTGNLPAIPNVSFAISDSRDVADLHIRAMLSPAAANQRFIGAGETLWFTEMADILRAHLPERKAIPTRRAPDWLIRVLALFQQDARLLKPMLGVREEMNAEKASRLLQWKSRSARETVIDCADSLIANKHV